MENNKTSRYFKYAIGEIILVVIGILIALQINNWNENRKINNLTKTYLINIKKDLITDTITFQSGIERVESTLEKLKGISNSDFIDSFISIDSLLKSVRGSFHSVRIYKINNSTFLKLTNSGFVESDSFKDILIEINEYYTKEYNTWSEYLKWDQEGGVDIFSHEFLDQRYDEIDLIGLSNKQALKSNSSGMIKNELLFKEFLKSNRFRNLVWTNYDEMQTLLNRMKHQKRAAAELITKINKVVSIK